MTALIEPLDLVDSRSLFQRWIDGDGPRSTPRYVYVASSWRNLYQQAVVGALRSAGIPHYDFRHPAPGNTGFNWREIDPNWITWTPEQWRAALDHPIAQAGFRMDFGGMNRADCGVLVLPSGRSSHLEVGYMAAQGTPIFTLALESVEPDLMALLLGPAQRICTSMIDLLGALGVSDS